MSVVHSSQTIPVKTLAERKVAEAMRRRLATAHALEGMRAYARANGGRFVVFGSGASGSMRFDSDLDVLVDFPAERVGAAWCFVENLCARLAIPPDLHDAATTTPAFVARVVAGGRVLS